MAPIDRMMAHFSQMRGEELRARMSTICVFRCRTEGSASLPSLLVFSGQPDISTHLLYTQIGVKALCELIVAALTVLSCFKKPLSCFWRLEGGGLELWVCYSYGTATALQLSTSTSPAQLRAELLSSNGEFCRPGRCSLCYIPQTCPGEIRLFMGELQPHRRDMGAIVSLEGHP